MASKRIARVLASGVWMGMAALSLPLWVGCSKGDRPAVPNPQPDPNPDPTPDPVPDDPPAQEGIPIVNAASIADLGLTLFDANTMDWVGPTAWNAKYGKLPELVAVPFDGGLDVLCRDQVSSVQRLWLLRLREDEKGALRLARAFKLPGLDLLLGFGRDAQGNFVYATAKDESKSITVSNPPANTHRMDIVHLRRFEPSGKLLQKLDLDLARKEKSASAEPLVNPGVFSSARLAVTPTQIALVHGINTAPDKAGTRHQKAAQTYLTPDGAIKAVSGIWMSHSLDQRTLVDGEDLYEVHLGDAYPRAIAVSRINKGVPGPGVVAYYPKGRTGDNDTYTRLGQMVKVKGGDQDGRFLLFYATERGTTSGSRDLAVTCLRADSSGKQPSVKVDEGFGQTWTVSSGGETRTNRALFLTDFQGESGGKSHVERVKAVSMGDGLTRVLFEKWTGSSFEGVYGLGVDAQGKVIQASRKLTQSHLPRGDDAFAWKGGAAWISGDAKNKGLRLCWVDGELNYREEDVL